MLLTERLTERVQVAGSAARRPEEFWALRDINFEVKRGETIGVIGHNGAGKSTLLKILSRITPPTEGEARLRGRVGALLEVGTGFHPELTGRENVFLNGAILNMKRQRDPAPLRRDRRVRRHRALHRHAREALLERHAAPARVLGGRSPRARDPDHRRGSLRGRPRLPAEVPRQDGGRLAGGPHRRLHQPQPARRSSTSATARSCSRMAGSPRPARSGRWSTPTSGTSPRTWSAGSGTARIATATASCASSTSTSSGTVSCIDSPATGDDFDIVLSFEKHSPGNAPRHPVQPHRPHPERSDPAAGPRLGADRHYASRRSPPTVEVRCRRRALPPPGRAVLHGPPCGRRRGAARRARPRRRAHGGAMATSTGAAGPRTG